MKAMILTALGVAALGVSSAYADGQGGVTSGYERWQAQNGNPTIPATQWFAQHRGAQVPQQQQVGAQSPASAPNGNEHS